MNLCIIALKLKYKNKMYGLFVVIDKYLENEYKKNSVKKEISILDDLLHSLDTTLPLPLKDIFKEDTKSWFTLYGYQKNMQHIERIIKFINNNIPELKIVEKQSKKVSDIKYRDAYQVICTIR
jgi:hypothetical protein